MAIREKFNDEQKRLQDLNVIAPVDEPAKWVSQIVVAMKKSGSLRICIDLKPLNAALKREHYQIPVIDDLLRDLVYACVFTKLDLALAFWHLKLDDESSVLTAFATVYGRLRLQFGLNVSSEIFQKRLNQELEDLPGVKCIADDVLIYGTNGADHERNLANFSWSLNARKFRFMHIC